MSAARPSVLCFGKLPAHADFIRVNAASREALAFDEWLRHGLYFARTQLGQGWEQAFAVSPQYRFLFYPENAERFLSGVMQASQDKSQRKYPFLASVLMDRRWFLDNQRHLTPVAFSQFFEQAQGFVRRATTGLDMKEMAEQTQALNGSILDPASTESLYKEKYLDALSLREFWEELFGSFEDLRKYLLLKNLAEVLLPFRDRGLSRMNVGLRFPLSGSGNMTEWEVCYWLQICHAFHHELSGTPFLFWNVPRDGVRGYVFVFFRQPSPRNFLQLIKPETQSDSICQMDEEGKDKLATVAQALFPGYRVLLDAGNEKLSHFLSGLKRIV